MKPSVSILFVVFLAVGCAWANPGDVSIATDTKVLARMSLTEIFADREARALAAAAGQGDVAAVRRLVGQGVDVNVRGALNATPLFWAMKNFEGFQALLALGADPNVIFDDGSSVMHWAARGSDARFLKAAVASGGDPNLRAGPFGGTPMFSAIGHSALENIDALLVAGADINARLEGTTPITRASSGNTPLLAAASAGDYDSAYHLLTRGADFTLSNDAGNTLTDYLAADRRVIVMDSPRGRAYQKVVSWVEARGTSTER